MQVTNISDRGDKCHILLVITQLNLKKMVKAHNAQQTL